MCMDPRSHAFIWTSQESFAQSVRNPGTYLYRIMFQCFQKAVLTIQPLSGFGWQLSSPCKFNMMKACIIQTLHLKKSYIHVALHNHPSILTESRVPNAPTVKHWFAARYPYKFKTIEAYVTQRARLKQTVSLLFILVDVSSSSSQVRDLPPIFNIPRSQVAKLCTMSFLSLDLCLYYKTPAANILQSRLVKVK